MALSHRILETSVDAFARVFAHMALAGTVPSSFGHVGAYFEWRIASHLESLGLEDEQIAGLFGHSAVRTVRGWRKSPPSLEIGQPERLFERIEQDALALESDVIEDFVDLMAPNATEDGRTRWRTRGRHLLRLLVAVGAVAARGPAKDRRLSAVPVSPVRGLPSVLWLEVHLHGPIATEALARAVGEPVPVVKECITALAAQGRVHETDDGWDCGQVALDRDAREWETAVPDHLSAVYATVTRHIQRFLPPGFVSEVPKGTGFDTYEFVLEGRDFNHLVGLARTFGETLDAQLGNKSHGDTLRVYLGQYFDRLPR